MPDELYHEYNNAKEMCYLEEFINKAVFGGYISG
jgi:hypothetical protein